MPYMSRRALSGLRDYKYQAGGYTILDAYHDPVWDWIVDHLPMWLAPNLITLMGLSALGGSYVATAWHLPELVGVAPRWVYWSCAAACFFYLHMDCLDGKQARRTGTSSPLGQLFDHGCDALAVVVIAATLTTTFNLGGAGVRPVVGCMIPMLPWIMAHWEEYHTGAMVYGNGLWGVTEANYVVVGFHIVTAVLGPEVWLYHPLQAWIADRVGNPGAHPWVNALPDSLLASLAGAQTNDITMAVIGTLGSIMVCEQLFRTGAALCDSKRWLKSLPRAERGHKVLGAAAAVSHVAQLAFFFVVAGAVLVLPSSAGGHLRLRYVAVGSAYALQASLLIVDHMSKEPFSIAAWPLAALAVIPANAYFGLGAQPDLLALAVALAVSTGYVHFAHGTVREICDYLGINALTIPVKGNKD